MPRLLAAALLVLAFAPRLSAADRPNILYVFADDQAFDTLHALGNEQIETPNLDRLVRGGTTFTRAYNMGGWHGAVCVASRTMLNTGRFLWHAQAEEKSIKKEYEAPRRTWSQTLAAAGYDTYFTGKWHVKMDTAKLFKVARHVRPGMPNQTDAGYNRPIVGQPDPWSPYDTKFEGFWKGGKHWSEIVADDCLDYLKMAEESDNPFFMYIAFNAPHDPRQSPKEYVDKYPPDEIEIPRPFHEEYPLDIGIKKIRDEVLAPYPRTEHAVRVNRAEYYAIITHLDTQIGRILDALEASGRADNTYVVFTADHGLACGHHGLMGKQNMHEHSVRVPFLVRGPGVPANEKRDARIYLQDVVPTSLEWAGVEVPEHVEFRSLRPLIEDDSAEHYDGIYGAYMMTQRMVTVGDWKLIVYPSIGKQLLYNLAEDPFEEHDLAGMPEHAKRIAELRTALARWQQESGDPLELK